MGDRLRINTESEGLEESNRWGFGEGSSGGWWLQLGGGGFCYGSSFSGGGRTVDEIVDDGSVDVGGGGVVVGGHGGVIVGGNGVVIGCVWLLPDVQIAVVERRTKRSKETTKVGLARCSSDEPNNGGQLDPIQLPVENRLFSGVTSQGATCLKTN